MAIRKHETNWADRRGLHSRVQMDVDPADWEDDFRDRADWHEDRHLLRDFFGVLCLLATLVLVLVVLARTL